MFRSIPPPYRFWLILALLFVSQVAIVGGFFLSIGLDLAPEQRALLGQMLTQRAAPLLLLAVLLLTAQGLALKTFIARYLTPLARLAEEAVLLTANPAHRIVPEGAYEVRELAGQLNTLAAAHQHLHEDVEARVDRAKRALAEEKNRLAALMSELAQGVVVCNIEGQILLYNTRARHLFRTVQGQDAGKVAIGLGRSLFSVLERSLIVHALEHIQHQLQLAEPDTSKPVYSFVTTLAQGQIVRAHMAPVLDDAQALHGFVLTLEDVTRDVEASNRRDAMQQLLTQDMRTALANIRTAAKAVHGECGRDEAECRTAAAIDLESQHLTHLIDRAEQRQSEEPFAQWHLEEMRGRDLLALLQRRIPHATLTADAASEIDDTLWLKVDSYSFTQAVAHLAHHLEKRCVTDLQLSLEPAGHKARLDLRWRGPLAPETLQLWEAEPLQAAAGKAQTLGSAICAQGRQAEYRFDPISAMSSYSVLLPLAVPRAPLEVAERQPGRPEFYDFDLFNQAGQNAASDQCPLTQLRYTVFDTETTGLHPAEGDEIISIGALRILNSRLLMQESFDQLVRPGRLLSPESTAIHGIDNAMLKGRPGIASVLPDFHRFAEDTILVAHNAAFDMKFLQMQEEETGICFTQPVLDTLLLSQVIHPHQKDHSLEAIARRFGVDIVGRHTALGDALVTAEVFLKMLPLLAEKGLTTLGQVREAVQRAAYAQLRY